MFSTIKIRSSSYKICCCWIETLFGVEMNVGHAQNTKFWCLLGVLSKFSYEHPVPFIGEYPPGSKSTVLLSY